MRKIALLSKRVRKEVWFGFDCLVIVMGPCCNVWFGSGKWFYSCIFLWFTEAGKRCSKAVHMLEKSVINVIWLFVPVSDRAIIMIGPGGLLLWYSNFNCLALDKCRLFSHRLWWFAELLILQAHDISKILVL
jgi:hypothetical protein